MYLKLQSIVLFVFLLVSVSLQTLFAQSNKVTEQVGHNPHVIPVRFALKKAGYVSLVIDNDTGFRVRNLISETWFPAGNNVVWWDGHNDLLRNADAANHGRYDVPAQMVTAGRYKVRGIVRQAITSHYEFTPYSTGTPPWSTPDHTGGWLANHTPPQAALYLPAYQSPFHKPLVLLGCYVTEGPDGLAWVDLDGRKLGGKKWVGGAWTAASFIAANIGSAAIPGVSAYTAAAYTVDSKTEQIGIRISALKPFKNDFAVGNGIPYITRGQNAEKAIGGFAVYNGLALVSLKEQNRLLVLDLKTYKEVKSLSINSPRGVAVDSTGKVLLLSGTSLLQFQQFDDVLSAGRYKTIIKEGLEDPYGLTVNTDGKIFISDRGNSNTIKGFDRKGKYLNTIGHPGPFKAGAYDSLHFNNPAGITIDEKHHLWVTEQDYLPKRVSIWTLNGQLLKAFYGPTKYGGGGTIDERDKTKYYYTEGPGSMEFNLDWNKGTSVLSRVFYRIAEGTATPIPPDQAIYHNGQRYFTNCYNSNPTGGAGVAFLFIDKAGIAVPAVAMGRALDWDILKSDVFKTLLPTGINLKGLADKNEMFFIWQDTNSNGQPEPQEVVFEKGIATGVTIKPDLSFCIANLNGKAVRYSPVSFSANGIPAYHIDDKQVLVTGIMSPATSGGNQMLASANGQGIVTLGIQPYSPLSLSGFNNGKLSWTYPDMWPGLHASHRAPIADIPGEVIGTTRLLGGTLDFQNGKTPPFWLINGNHGNVYAFTNDGIFIATLFKSMRQGKVWNMYFPVRGMSLDSVSLGEENFWPTVTKTSDGNVYMIDGARSSVVRLNGFETIERLPDSFIDVTSEKLNNLNVSAKAVYDEKQMNKQLTVLISKSAPIVDGKLDDWGKLTDWALINNPAGSPIKAAMQIYNGRMYLVYVTDNKTLLNNTGENPLLAFKTGGALDLMIGTSVNSSANRIKPQQGDCRLLVTIVKGKPLALVYKSIVPGTPVKDKIQFSSPTGTVTFDKVVNVSDDLQFKAQEGIYELSVPLKDLDLKVADFMKIKGDIGVLTGVAGQTLFRSYWNNTNTSLVSDLPSEAQLNPNLWGWLLFKRQ